MTGYSTLHTPPYITSFTTFLNKGAVARSLVPQRERPTFYYSIYQSLTPAIPFPPSIVHRSILIEESQDSGYSVAYSLLGSLSESIFAPIRFPYPWHAGRML